MPTQLHPLPVLARGPLPTRQRGGWGVVVLVSVAAVVVTLAAIAWWVAAPMPSETGVVRGVETGAVDVPAAVPMDAQVAAEAGVPPGAPLSSPLAGVPVGTGAGTHSPSSAFPALVARSDVVPWTVLTDVALKYRHEKRRLMPVFNASVQAMQGSPVRVQGYLMPLTPGTTHTRFLLTSVPLTCPYCTPGGPESMVDVEAREPVRYVEKGVVMQGRLQVLPDDDQGRYYRLVDAVAVP